MTQYTIENNVMRFSTHFNESLEPYYEIMKYNHIRILIFDSLPFPYQQINYSLVLIPIITYVKLCDLFNNSIVFSKGTKGVMFGNLFDKTIDLSKNITHATLGFWFNTWFRLTKYITHLILGKNFFQPINLNKNIKHLSFGHYFNFPIDLNKSIERLRLGYCFHKPMIFGKNITYFVTCARLFKSKHFDWMPPNTSVLIIDRTTNEFGINLPNSLNEIIRGPLFNTPIDNMPNCTKIFRWIDYRTEIFYALNKIFEQNTDTQLSCDS